MAITNASRLADFGSGIGTAGAVLQIDNANDRIGIGTTNTQSVAGVALTSQLTVGIVSCYEIYQDSKRLALESNVIAYAVALS